MNEGTLKNHMITNALSYNKHLTKTYLNDKGFNELLCFCHPLDRADFIEMKKEIERQKEKKNEGF